MKLLIIGYCHLDDGFLYASKALEKVNYEIYFFPYLQYFPIFIILNNLFFLYLQFFPFL